MRVFDLVGDACGQRAGTRVAVIGSCRVHDPFETLANNGRAVRVWANPSSAIHTFGEARQIVQYTRGELEIPPSLRSYIFFPAEPLPRSPADKRILDTVDAVFVEVSELRQISHDPYFFQANFFYRDFVSKYGSPLLPWYRAFSLGHPIGDELVAEAMSKLADRSEEERAGVEKVLRGTRLVSPDVSSAAAMLDGIIFDRAKQWTLVSHFLVPGMGGTQMKDRAQLIDVVRQAAAMRGAAMFDPTMILEQYGREVALASAGRDIYHYNADIYESVANRLLACAGLLDSKSSVALAPTGESSEKRTAAAAAEWVNDKLIELHQERVAALGIDGSGLYTHYKGLMDMRQIAGPGVGELANLVANLLPRFDRYDVLRAGLGELTFVLAALDLRSTGFDLNPRRFSAMVAGLEKLANDDGDLARRVMVGRAGVPNVAANTRTLAIVHHLIGFTSAQEEQMLDQLSAYDALLFDPRIFLFPRDSALEQEAVVEMVRARGFTHMREYPKLGVVFCAKPDFAKSQTRTDRDGGRGVAEQPAAPIQREAPSPSPAQAEKPEPAPALEIESRTWSLEGPFHGDAGGAWVCNLESDLHSLTDIGSSPYRSHLRLLEDGQELGPGHARHETIRKDGGGYYSFWGDALYFSASDGSDPNTNGRSYSIALVR